MSFYRKQELEGLGYLMLAFIVWAISLCAGYYGNIYVGILTIVVMIRLLWLIANPNPRL